MHKHGGRHAVLGLAEVALAFIEPDRSVTWDQEHIAVVRRVLVS